MSLVDDKNLDQLIENLLRALEVSEGSHAPQNISLENVFKTTFALSQKQFSQVAFDLSLLSGSSGDWQMAYKLCTKLEEANNSTNVELIKIWQLRCLVELEKYSEALAIVGAREWSSTNRIHVNYLSGQAYKALGMNEEAQSRFDAVNRKNPNYRDVAQKLVKD